MKILFLSLLLLSTLSCRKDTELIIEKDKVVGMENLDAYIDGIKIMPWKVGDFHAHTLHKGFLLMVKLPNLDKEDVIRVATTTPVNSWLVRFYKRTLGNDAHLLGSVYVPFWSIIPSSGERRYEPPTGIYVNIYYAAAALSGRLEHLKCPALNHRKVIEDYKITSTQGTHKAYFSFNNTVNDNPAKAEILPEVFNGESSLIGEYFVEVALYNSESKVLHSDFFNAGNVLKIESEEDKVVKDCDNFVVPTIEPNADKLKLFRLKKE